jgi:hypothetical protein
MGRQNRVRQIADLGRQSPTRRPRECILIVCEGVETEPNYFRSLRRKIGLNTVEVEIVGEGAEIVGVVDEAIRYRNERADEANTSNQKAPFDEVWCVADTERPNDNPSWERGVIKANKNGLKLAWSNPCFEFWLLLHFERLGRSFDGYSDVRPCLSRHIKHYEKSADCFEQLAPRIPTAIDHSKQIHRSQWQNTTKPIECNPATTVHELVEKLIEIAGMTVQDYQERYPLPEMLQPKRKRARRS